MATLLAVVKAEYDYQAQNDEELTISENDVLYVLEDDDPEWWKVRVKTAPTEDASAAPTGLVPATYVSPLPALAEVTSLYVYDPQNDEELAVAEDEPLTLYERDGDWVLVGRTSEGAKGVGYIPATWIDESGAGAAAEAPAEEAEEEEESTPAPAKATTSFLPPPTRNAQAAASNVQTWQVTEIDGKKKKKKGTLGIGNGALFFASESDKTPVQQYPLSSLSSHSTEKSKHLYLSFADAELHFTISSKSTLDEIVAKLEASGVEPSPTPSITRADSNSPPPHRPAPAFAPSAPVNGSHAAAADDEEGQPATVLYDFTGEGDDELSVVDGERVIVLDASADDWWKVRRTDRSAQEGVVPASYVELDGAASGDADTSAADEQARIEAEEEAERQRLEEEAAAADAERVAAEDAEAAAAASAAARARASADAARREEARRKAAESKRSVQPPSRPPAEPPRPAARASSTSHVPKPAHDESKRSKPREDKVRMWRDRTGQFKVEAEFLGIANGKIRLHKLNGVIIEVPVSKMSDRDAEYIKRVVNGQRGGDDSNARSRAAPVVDDDDLPLASRSKQPSGHSRPSTASSAAAAPAARSAQPRRPDIDWFEFFLNAGCDMDDCTRYGNNFQRDRIDESILPELDRESLIRLGLREGDVLRVLKHIRAKHAPRENKTSTAEQEQIRRDEDLARQLQGLPPLEPSRTGSSAASSSGSGLFTGPNGALKSTRRGRPTRERSVADKVSADTLTSASEQLSSSAGRGSTPPLLSRSPAPPADVGTRRSSSTIPMASGFDDDAWTNRPASKPTTPVPPPAPTPPPAPPAPQPAQAAQQPARPSSAAAPGSSAQDLNESILASLGITNRPPSAPLQRQQASPAPQSQPQQQPSYNGPRGPHAPVAGNAPLLNPLVPTHTANFGFVPTRPGGIQPSRSPMMPQQTGFQPMMAQPTGYGTASPMMGQPTGFSGAPPVSSMSSFSSPMMAQPTGFQSSVFQPQPTGFQPQQTGYQQPQPTGYQQPSMGFSSAPPSFGSTLAPQPTGYGGMIPQQTPSPQPSFGAPPQQQQQQPQQSSAPTRFDPTNVFASMKQGTFAKDPSAAPQPEQKYDALRPQPTGMGFAPGGLVSQPTGVFAGFQAPLPSQQQQQQPPMGMPQQQPYGQPQYGQQQQPYRQYY